jgi:hypothetical protein
MVRGVESRLPPRVTKLIRRKVMGLNHAIAPRRLKPFRAFLPDRLRGRLKGRASGKRLKDRIKRLAV